MKPIFWVGGTKEELKSFPRDVQRVVGRALFIDQTGGKARSARPLKGFAGAGVLEVVDDHDGDTFRAVYTVLFKDAVYVLHAFQKKSKRGIATPRQEIEMIRQRLRAAEVHHASAPRS